MEDEEEQQEQVGGDLKTISWLSGKLLAKSARKQNEL